MRYIYSANHGSPSQSSVSDWEFIGQGQGSVGSTYLNKSFAPVTGDIENWDITLGVAPGGAASWTFQLLINGTLTGPTIVISGAATTGSASGVVVSVTAGDTVQMRVTPASTPASMNGLFFSRCEMKATTDNEYGMAARQGTMAGGPWYANPFHPLHNSVTAAEVAVAVAAPCTMTALMMGSHFAALAAGVGFFALVELSTDGGVTYVAQDGTGGTVDTVLDMSNQAQNVTKTRTFSLALARGDLFRIRMTRQGAPNGAFSMGTRFVASVPGEANYSIGDNGSSSSSSNTNYAGIKGGVAGGTLGWSISDGASHQRYVPANGFELKDPVIWTLNAPGSGRTRTITLRKNAADTAVVCALTGTTAPTVASVTGLSETFVSGDTFSIRHDPAGTPVVTSTPRWTYIFVDLTTALPALAMDDAYSTPMEVPLVEPVAGVLDNDVTRGGGTMTAVLDVDVTNGVLVLNADGSFTYTPNPGFVGLDTFTYHVSDTNGDSNIATVTITVTDIGGGEGPAGTNPSANGNLLTTLPIVFVYIRLVDGTVLVYSQADLDHLSDRSVWYGGKKKAKIIGFSPVRRRFSKDGGFQAYPWSIELDDQDSELRTAARGRTLKGAEVFCFVVDDSVRRAEGVPFKFATGIITHHDGDGGMTYTLYVEGALARRMNRANMQAKIPPGKLNDTETPGIDKGLIGQAGPVALGMLSDSAESAPEGVVRALYMGTTNLQTICGGGAANVMVDAYLLSMGAAGRVYNTFYEPPVWGDETVHVLGDLVRPADDTQFVYECTTAGTTDTSEPTWPVGVGATVVDGTVTWTRRGALTSFGRYQVPLDAYGVAIAAPYMPNWTAVTGLATNYVDWGTPTRRYTPVFVLNSHRYARAIREGRIILTANMAGQTDLPDGTGLIITAPERQITFLLANQIFHSTDTWTTHNTFPTFTDPDGTVYSVVDVDSFETQRLLSCSFLPPDGYVGAALLGRGGQQQNAFDVLREFCQGSNLQLGENHHGQIIAHRHNPLSSFAVTFTEQDDLRLKDGLDWSVNTDELCNAFDLRYGFRYADTARAGLVGDAETWVSGLKTYIHTAAVNAVGERLTKVHDFYTIRHSSTAWDVALRHEQAFVGTLANSFFPYDGQKIYTLKTRWQGVSKGGVEVDLGVTVGVSHREGVTALNTHRMTIEEQIIYPLEGLVHNIGPILDA